MYLQHYVSLWNDCGRKVPKPDKDVPLEIAEAGRYYPMTTNDVFIDEEGMCYVRVLYEGCSDRSVHASRACFSFSSLNCWLSRIMCL